MRCLLPGLASLTLMFAEEPVVAPPVVELPVTAFEHTGPGYGTLLLGQLSSFEGVTMRMEDVRLACHRLQFRLDGYPGATKPVLMEAMLAGGPSGPADGNVLFDSSKSRLPQMSFKGVLRPRTLTLHRKLPESGSTRPNLVRFQIEASDLGNACGVTMTAAGERQHIIWADHLVLEFEAPLTTGSELGFGSPCLRAMHFYGRPERDGVPRRTATVLRMLKDVMIPPNEADVLSLVAANTYGLYAAGMVLTLGFNEQGELQYYQNPGGAYEDRSGEGIVPMRATTQPKIGP